MGIFDLIIICLLALGAYRGFRKGFIREVIALLAFILAIIGGFKLLHVGMEFLSSHFEINGQLLPYIAFLIVFVAIIVGLNLLGALLKKMVHATILGGFDSIAGAIIGLLKWAFGLSVLLWLTTYIGLFLPENMTEDSYLYTYIAPIAPAVVDFIAYVLPFARDLFDTIEAYFKSEPI